MRAALFDLDETILDRSGSLRDFANWQATEIPDSSISNTTLFVERFIELDQNGVVWKDKVYESLICEFNIKGYSVEDLLNTYLERFRDFCKPRHGALDVIQAFARKEYKIALVSNGKTPFQENNFQALGFNEFFDCVIISDAVGIRKPDKAIFELACKSINADISASVFIGDNPVADIKGAKDAGMATIYVPTDPQQEPCRFADKTFYQLSDLAAHIEANK